MSQRSQRHAGDTAGNGGPTIDVGCPLTPSKCPAIYHVKQVTVKALDARSMACVMASTWEPGSPERDS
ncbi:hypothetical protein DICA3_F25950 [Diutina catenulata]